MATIRASSGGKALRLSSISSSYTASHPEAPYWPGRDVIRPSVDKVAERVAEAAAAREARERREARDKEAARRAEEAARQERDAAKERAAEMLDQDYKMANEAGPTRAKGSKGGGRGGGGGRGRGR
ncbi:hypothetical protein MNEG_15038 [Monoraphidium neglectum]|uniref:Uncharacterized protein n=1 Tax=Monoraphidium neglectum TaxID=145388 RepID=A0A0D2MCC7_9CHLO|nr:hypothetical protein MNEG_15038 [Monoraphidium neglectum]KIY92925.1 hypothetical protein MNEG_15038 [Monoraphidium neglectum]|eukprot:XP_013891945.1 hypothetical protein MNEG_15038 [Monoraphidium neglectum]